MLGGAAAVAALPRVALALAPEVACAPVTVANDLTMPSAAFAIYYQKAFMKHLYEKLGELQFAHAAIPEKSAAFRNFMNVPLEVRQ